MSKSQSKEFFKKKQRGRNKKNSIASSVIVGNSSSKQSGSTGQLTRQMPTQTSQGNITGLLNGDEDPAVAVINPHPPTLTSQVKEKRTKICCLL